MYDTFASSERFVQAQKKFLYQVYAWMGIAILITAFAAFFTSRSDVLLNLVFGDGKSFPIGLLLLVVAEVIMVWVLASKVFDLKFETGLALFAVYSLLNGVTLAIIFRIYTSESIATTFFICAAMFFAMSLYGWTTKADLSKLGNILMMALFGLIIAGLINFFLRSSVLNYIISFIGVLVFTGLTAYDTWKLKKVHEELEGQPEMARKLSVLGALSLYLDFVNLFLMLLQFFGRRD